MNAFFSAILTAIKTQEGIALIPPVITFLAYVDKNPTNKIGILTQAVVLKDQMIAAQPTIVASEINAMSNTLIGELQAELAKLEAAPQAATPSPKA
jgi:hypothetical protein